MSWGRRMPIWPFLLASNSIFRRPCQHGPAKTNREWEGERVRFIYSWDWNHKVLPKEEKRRKIKMGSQPERKLNFHLHSFRKQRFPQRWWSEVLGMSLFSAVTSSRFVHRISKYAKRNIVSFIACITHHKASIHAQSSKHAHHPPRNKTGGREHLRAIFLVRTFSSTLHISGAFTLPALGTKGKKIISLRPKGNFVEAAFIAYAVHEREIRPEGWTEQITLLRG